MIRQSAATDGPAMDRTRSSQQKRHVPSAESLHAVVDGPPIAFHRLCSDFALTDRFEFESFAVVASFQEVLRSQHLRAK